MMSFDWTCDLTAGIFANSPPLAQLDWTSPTALALLCVLAVALVVARLRSAKLFAAGLILILFVVHQDFWNWGVTERSIGGLPQGFVFHVGLSIAAAIVWWIIAMDAWPKDEWVDETARSSGSANSGTTQPSSADAADNSGANQ